MLAVASEHADVIAVTGDLVHLALGSEIAEARDWLEELARVGHVILVPGNHDLYQHDAVTGVLSQWAPYLRLTGTQIDSFPSVQKWPGITVIGVSSALPEPFWSAAGEVGRAQLERLELALTDSQDDLRCILIHHPPSAQHCHRRKALRDSAAVQQLCERFGVEMILHGHIHRNQCDKLNARTHVFATASASNAAAHARASYRVFEITSHADAWQVCATLKTLSAADGGVETVHEQVLNFSRSR
jgi:3',5'-cyclic AMP phosphodiesterase CpdA